MLPGRGLKLDRKDRLHGVDHDQCRLQAGHLLEDALDARFREQVERCLADAEAVATALDLVLRFLSRSVEDRANLTREMSRRLQQERRLADAGLAAQQHQRSRDETPAEHTIELLDPGREARRIGDIHLGVQLRRSGGAQLRIPIRPTGERGRFCSALLDQRVPRAAFTASPQPLGRLRAALLADEDDFGNSHVKT